MHVNLDDIESIKQPGAELSYGKVWQSPYLEFSAIIFLESLYTMNRLRNIKFGCYKVWVAGQR
jgi:hypothetical protein